MSNVTGQPTGATADPHATDASAANIPVVGWELSIAPTGSPTAREQVGEGGPFAVTVTLRGTPGPGALMAPWSVTGGVTAPGQTCAAAASAADFMGGAFPSGTLDLSGATTGTITVQTASDTMDESAGAECFTLTLGTLTGAQSGAVAVLDGSSAAYAEIADALRTLSASVVSGTVDEDSVTAAGQTANVEFEITMRGTVNPETAVMVPWTLSSPDDSLTLSAGGAGLSASSLATRDLGPGASVSGTVTFAANTDVSGMGNTITVTVPIAQDALNEGVEQLRLTIGQVERNAGVAGTPGAIPGTLVSTRTADAMVSASDDITVFLAPDPNQGTLTAGESARYTMSFGTTTVNGQVVPIVPTTEVRIPLTVMVGSQTVTLDPAAATPETAAVESGNTVVVPSGSTQVTVVIPDTAINAGSQSGTPMLTVQAQAPTGTPAGAEARAATMQDAAAETQRTGQTVTATPPPAQVAGWELTIAQPDSDQAPEGTGYRVTFTVEGDRRQLTGGIQIPWAITARQATPGGLQASPADFGPSTTTPPAYSCGAPADGGACMSFPSGTVTIAQGAAEVTTLTIEIFDDGIEEGMTPEGFTLTLSPLMGTDSGQTQLASGSLQLGALAVEIPALRVDLSVANAIADEGENAEFVVTLSNFSGGERTTQPIAVTFALASGPQPGGAQLGVDFRQPASLTTSIVAGATEGTTHRIPVWLVPDGLPEPPETFTLSVTAASGGGGTVRLVNAAGVQTQIAATGTISGAGDAAKRRSERVSTLVSVLDRSTAILAADAIGQRLDRGMPGSASQSSQLSIANRNLIGSGEANTRAAASDLGLALYGAPGMGGAAAGLPGSEGAGLESAGGAFGGLGVGLSGGANQGRNMALPSLAEMLSGSRFNFGAAAWTDLSTLANDVEVWGSGGYTDLKGDPQQGGSKLDYDGNNFAFFVGADRPLRPDLLAGVAVGYSVGDLDFTDTSSGFTTKGNLSTSMLSVHPYVGFWLTPNLNTWLMLGYGSGSVDVDETDTWALGAATQTAQRDLPGDSDSNMWMIATGVAGRVQVAESTGVKLSVEVARVHSELDAARFSDGALLPKLSAHSLRMGGEAEVNHRVQIGMVQIQPFVSARMRIETGDAVEQGAGQERDAAFDVGGGVSAQLPDLGIDGRIAVSGQLNETGHEERRVSVDLNYDLSGDSQGLTLAVQTAIRQRKSGLLNGLGVTGLGAHGSAVGGASSLGGSLSSGVGKMEQSISGEIGYGVAFQQFGRSGLLTPYGRFDLGQNDSLYAAGLRLNASSGLSLGLEGVLDPEDSYQLRLTGQLSF
ncbi:MAG: autotransporter outer membrane beta-barrel domain-containing protein [Deltaproteobacteria bacterium]|nr:autotransporter outer membrane beta-barrel domain-containing protein [Deltaproteobacteria bacterium]